MTVTDKTTHRRRWAVVRSATERPLVPISIGLSKRAADDLGKEMGYEVVPDEGQFKDPDALADIAVIIERLAIHQLHKQAVHAAAPWRRRR